jgi:hypothetical protein
VETSVLWTSTGKRRSNPFSVRIPGWRRRSVRLAPASEPNSGSGYGATTPPRVLKISVTERLASKYGGVPRNPATGTFDIGEWRGGQKSTIWGVHESGTVYRILVREKPVELTLEEILLPYGWRLRLIRPTEFGPWDPEDDETTEAGRIRAADRRVAERRWRGGGGSH